MELRETGSLIATSIVTPNTTLIGFYNKSEEMKLIVPNEDLIKIGELLGKLLIDNGIKCEIIKTKINE